MRGDVRPADRKGDREERVRFENKFEMKKSSI